MIFFKGNKRLSRRASREVEVQEEVQKILSYFEYGEIYWSFQVNYVFMQIT